MNAEGLQARDVPPGGAQLTDSLLATVDQNMGLDWKMREPLRARLKVVCKRVIVQFGFEAAKAEEVAERLVTWMRIQVPDPTEASREAS